MKELLESIFSGAGFMPHGHCYLWTPGLMWLHVGADALIVLAYYSIPVALVYFVRKRTDVNFGSIFIWFAAFILACGTTHLLEIWNVWHSYYWLSGSVKVLTALASVTTAVLLIKLIPIALALPRPALLVRANAALEEEIRIRQDAEQRMHDMNTGLEVRVADRTAELKTANEELLLQITERKVAERRIEHFAELFQALSHRLLDVQEEERRHLARELHDEIGQTLTAAKLNLKIIAPHTPSSMAGRLDDSVQLLNRLLEQVRQLSLDLRPPLLDELGLVPALRWLADQQTQRARLPVDFVANVEGLEMESSLRTACFRVAQEAITNAIRHAQAGRVSVEIRAEEERVWLFVRDDGVGFDKDAMHLRAARGASIGLLSMNERVSLLGGELEVRSAPRQGTEIRASFPRVAPERAMTD